jgi:hypothetical protein
MLNIGFMCGLCVGAVEFVSSFGKPVPKKDEALWIGWQCSSGIRWATAGMITQLGITTLFNIGNDRSITGALSLGFTIGELAYAILKLEEKKPQLYLKVKSIFSHCFSHIKPEDGSIERITVMMREDWERAKSGKDTDVVLKVGIHEFKAHKFILSNRCEYFRPLLNGQFSESNVKKIEIKERQPRIIELGLMFIYLQDISKETISNQELLLLCDLADYWLLPALTMTCNEIFKRRVRNALRLNGLPDNIEVE